MHVLQIKPEAQEQNNLPNWVTELNLHKSGVKLQRPFFSWTRPRFIY